MNKLLLLGALIITPHLQVPAQSPVSGSHTQAKPAAAGNYDPGRDSMKDVQEAIAEAKRTGKRILLEVGGNWCSWCRTMDRYFEENPKLLEFREKHFVTVRINFSPENENKALLSRYPEIPGYPHLFVLETTGELLHSQDTSDLESGKSYDLEKFLAFLKKWARS